MSAARVTRIKVEEYLASRHQAPVVVEKMQPLGGSTVETVPLKAFGYGAPISIDYAANGRHYHEVLHRIRANQFGRERADDRAAAVWLDFTTFNQLPRHVPAVDMIALTHDGSLASIADAVDLMLVTTYQPGCLYADDLLRLRDTGVVRAEDQQRARALARYLAEIHQIHRNDPPLWQRRLRDLIGDGEGIMGLTDSYGAYPELLTARQLHGLEIRANEWRWRLKSLPHRLAQVHGDFHPFNIVFRTPVVDGESVDFVLLDRSRGAWGEPADDVSCLSINYLFFSLQRCGTLADPFLTLYRQFWETYLTQRPDDALGQVIQPWLAWRALVLASPIWYPKLSPSVRTKMLNFARNVLVCDTFDYLDPERYFDDD